jgi:hypothetical protein
MLTALKVEEVAFQVRFSSLKDPDTIQQVGKSRFQCSVDQVAQLQWTILNKRDSSVKLCFRLEALQDFDNGDLGTDTAHKLLFTGSQQRVLDAISPGGQGTCSIQLLCLVRGDYKILYHAEAVDNTVEASLLGEDFFWCTEPICIRVV